jgi:hypothetical protein
MFKANFNVIKNYVPIGISGAARSGKDTLCLALIRYLSELNVPATRKSIAGDSIKRDLNSFILKHFSIDSFTENLEKKEFIRPLLVEYGKMKRKNTKGRYFIDNFKPDLDKINILPDIRYMEYTKDEIFWLKNEVNGFLIFIERKNVHDANDTEKINNEKIKKMADFILNWDTLNANNYDDLMIINNHAKNIIDNHYLPFSNRTT